MLQRLRERLTLLLLGLLPLHALLVTVGTRLLRGPGHAPWAVLALWKEVLLVLVMILALVEMVRSRKLPRIDAIDVLVLGMLALSALLGVWLQTSASLFLLGVRYDFVPLVAFLVLRRVPWSSWFRASCQRLLIALGACLSVVGICSLLLPTQFFVWLGYSDVHSLYMPNQPLAPYQQIGESWMRRIQSTMSGPNQFGIWLLLPLGLLLASWKRRKFDRVVLALLFLALLLTLSRSAWIASACILIVATARLFPAKFFHRMLVIGGSIAAVVLLFAMLLLPSVVFRLSSTRGHLVRPLQAMGKIWDQPLGHGLGSAGPASNRVSETCVFLRPQDNPDWAKSQPQLCVFLGTTQVQPIDHPCTCPFLPENWYLQMGVELGIIGMASFLGVIFLVLLRLQMVSLHAPYARGALLSMIGVSIAALFLHAWEDAAVAYTAWILTASAWGIRE